MGFTVIVEGNFGFGFADTRLPTKQGGKAVFAFLSVLSGYCILDEKEDGTDLEREWRKWFKHLQTTIEQPLCEVFKPIMDCMWGDGGGIGGDFYEDEYAWYLKRTGDWNGKMTEAEFRQFVIEGAKRWSSIDAVMANVKLLIDVFKTKELDDTEALYVAQDTIPDFESLYETLKILDDFGYENVRLNFS